MKNITVEDVHHLMLNIDAHEGPKAIKVTSRFLRYLENKYIDNRYCPMHNLDGVQAQFVGIPVELDDTIDSQYYELVW